MAEPLDPVREAVLAAALLALGLQRRRAITAEEFDRVCDYATDSLHSIGAFVDLDDLKGIEDLPADEGVRLVTSLKSKITNAIGGASSAFTSQVFELTFDFYLVTTAPEAIPALEGRLLELAGRVGLEGPAFSEVLRTAETDPASALTRFEENLERLIAAASHGSQPRLADAVDLKLNLGILTLDLKKLLGAARARIGK